ncbi:MAG: sugar phosphate isomerase/epimerase family protein [Planctomycetota bacterium]
MKKTAQPAKQQTTPCMRLGCQTITWDKERTEKRDYTVQAVARAGYEGVEIGARFLDLDHPQEFKRVLDENGVRLIAIHTGWNPFLGESGKGAGEIARAIAFAQVAKTPYLAMSGKDDEAQLLAQVEGLNTLGEKCRENGMTFCYHNHWWEIRDRARLLAEIERRTDPDLVSFCPDIGWVRKVTPDVTDVLGIIESRIRLVHFKDYVADGLDAKDNETEFGQGVLDFEGAFAFLRRLPVGELWVIAEQWKSTENHLPPEESIQRNCEFLKTLIGDERR